MDKILETYKEIVTGMRKNAVKTYSMTIIAVVVIICFSFVTLRLFEISKSNTLILDYDGYVRSATAIHADSASLIRCKAFVDDFSQHFFSFNSLNLKQNLEYSLELGDNSIKNAYMAFRNKNWYNDVIQNNLDQSIKITRIDTQHSGANFNVYCEAIVCIQDISGKGDQLHYALVFTFFAKNILPEYPRFKQGFYIQDFNYDIKAL